MEKQRKLSLTLRSGSHCSKCTEGLGLSETCITALKDNVSNEQGAAKTMQGIKRTLATIKKFCRRARYVPPNPVLEFLVLPVLLDIADEHHNDSQFEKIASILNCLSFVRYQTVCKFITSVNIQMFR